MTAIDQADAVMRAIDELRPWAPGAHPVVGNIIGLRKAWQRYAHESTDEHVHLVKAMGDGVVSSMAVVYRERERFEREASVWCDDEYFWRGLDPAGTGHEMFQVQLVDGGWLSCYFVPHGA